MGAWLGSCIVIMIGISAIITAIRGAKKKPAVAAAGQNIDN